MRRNRDQSHEPRGALALHEVRKETLPRSRD
jgi:hypothetical protein